MKFVKYLLLSLASLSLTLLSLGTFAAAQTDHNHDHANEPHADQTPPQTPVLPTEGVYSELGTDHVIGAPMAPVTMIVYASVTCPHCASWFNSVWLDIKKNYVDKSEVRVVLREFPTAPQDYAVIGFQIANCAPSEKYFPMIEYLMKEQENILLARSNGTGKEKFLEISKNADLNSEAEMMTCIQNQAGIERINKSILLARAAGINSVPSLIIDGKVYKGGLEYLPLSKYLDTLSKRGYSAIPE